MRSLAILLLLASAAFGIGTASTTRDLGEFFGGRDGCFVLYDCQTDSYLRYNPKSCSERCSPCSTFKIPHTLLALETGIASGPDFALRWDGVKRSISAWNADQTLRTALQNSVVWFYQELARRIGEEREKEFLRKLAYGNMDISGGLTNFWLQSSLTISADEQVGFLRRLWTNGLPVSREAQRTTRSLLELSRQDDRVLYGKTGSGKGLGWFVGCVQRGPRTVVFATRITGYPDASGKEARRISEAILRALGV